jgi:hypothetical protein
VSKFGYHLSKKQNNVIIDYTLLPFIPDKTVLLDQAIRDLAANYGVIYQFKEESVLEKVEQETWEEIAE